jgi:LysM repeat protein
MHRKTLLVFVFIFVVGNLMLAWSRNASSASQLAQIPITTVQPASPTVFSESSTATGQSLPATKGRPSYVVREGDTLFSIAAAYGISQDALAAANQITNPGTIYAGEALFIPLLNPTDGTSVANIPTTPLMDTSRFQGGLPAPAPVPGDVLVNGLAADAIVLLPENVKQHVRQVYAQGQALGRNPRAFAKIGDSTIENPHFLARFDSSPYHLGAYSYLQPLIDYFHGSFGRQGSAVRRGLHSWSVFDPLWADKSMCMGGETPITCEFRLQNPSFVFIRLGSNDVGVPEMFSRNLRQMVEFCLNNGVVPILGTKADQHEGSDINNETIRRVAADYAVPLWDFERVSQTLPNRGLVSDGVHMTTFFAHDYTSPVAFQRGHGVHNLSALIALDQVWRTALEGSQDVVP